MAPRGRAIRRGMPGPPLCVALLLGAALSLGGCFAGRGVSAAAGTAPWPTLTPRPRAVAVGSSTPTVSDSERTEAGSPAPPTATVRSPHDDAWGPPAAEQAPERLRIPSVGIDTGVVTIRWVDDGKGGEGSWQDPGSQAGWLAGSALPGAGSNVVMVGHHNVRGEVLRDLVRVQMGDAVYVEADGRTYAYVVRERFIVPERYAPDEQRQQNALWIAPTYDERLTLVTCWPYTDNTHRLIVIAKPGPLPPSATLAVSTD